MCILAEDINLGHAYPYLEPGKVSVVGWVRQSSRHVLASHFVGLYRTLHHWRTNNEAFHGREYGCCNEPCADFTNGKSRC